MPLVRRYKSDKVFQTKRITEMWSTDTMNIQVKSLDRKQYTQVFFNGTCYSEIYTMAKKDDMGTSLDIFVMEPGVLEGLTV